MRMGIEADAASRGPDGRRQTKEGRALAGSSHFISKAVKDGRDGGRRMGGGGRATLEAGGESPVT